MLLLPCKYVFLSPNHIEVHRRVCANMVYMPTKSGNPVIATAVATPLSTAKVQLLSDYDDLNVLLWLMFSTIGLV